MRHARPEDAAGMARAFVDAYHAGHRGQMPQWLIETRTYATSERGWRRTLDELADDPEPDRCVLVAESAGDIAGVVMGGPTEPWAEDEEVRAARPTGELYALYVDPRHWRRGGGRALLEAAAAWLAARGRRRLLVGVLAANGPARRFYETVGGRLLGYRPIEDEGVVLEEAVYVWDDVGPSADGP